MLRPQSAKNLGFWNRQSLLVSTKRQILQQSRRNMSKSSAEKYTDPDLRDQIKEEFQAGDMGGKPAQWTASKWAQWVAKEYKYRGRAHKGPKDDRAKGKEEEGAGGAKHEAPKKKTTEKESTEDEDSQEGEEEEEEIDGEEIAEEQDSKEKEEREGEEEGGEIGEEEVVDESGADHTETDSMDDEEDITYSELSRALEAADRAFEKRMKRDAVFIEDDDDEGMEYSPYIEEEEEEGEGKGEEKETEESKPSTKKSNHDVNDGESQQNPQGEASKTGIEFGSEIHAGDKRKAGDSGEKTGYDVAEDREMKAEQTEKNPGGDGEQVFKPKKQKLDA